MGRQRSLDQEKKRFEESASAYCDYLREHHPEHFMESTPQGKQREITMASLAQVHERRPDVQYFNELLVQYVRKGETKIRKVVPDNMIVVHEEAIEAVGNYAIPLQPVGPLWMLEYVSKGNERKDYEDSFAKYERDLRVPYYLTFYPDNDELTLYRLNTRKRYSSVKPNDAERYPIPELELEVALLGGWVRFWFRGELVPLTGEMLRELDEERRRNQELRKQVEQEAKRAEDEAKRAELAESQLADLRAQLERLLAKRKSG